jgi:hypothetical protein
MRRHWTAFVLITCLFWQSFAHAGAQVWMSEGEDVVHAVMHFVGEGHHHDDHDGGFHQDDSPASNQHAMADACVFAPTLPVTTGQQVLLATAPDVPAIEQLTPPIQPFLQGLERPPKSIN